MMETASIRENPSVTHIILNDDQVKAVQAAATGVELRDAEGHVVGYVAKPASKDVVAEAKRRLNSDGPWHTTQEVLDSLNALEQ